MNNKFLLYYNYKSVINTHMAKGNDSRKKETKKPKKVVVK